MIYGIIVAKEKQAAAEQTFVFLAAINEQTSDKIGQKARKREFASLDDIMSIEKKQAAAEQTFFIE